MIARVRRGVLAFALAGAVPAAGDTIRVAVREDHLLEAAGATAAYSLDAGVAEASARDGRVIIHGTAPGSTVIAVVGADGGVVEHELVVIAPAGGRVADAAKDDRSSTLWQEHFDSEVSRLTSTFDLQSRSASRSVRLHATNVTRTSGSLGAEARSSMPSAALEVSAGERELVVLDHLVEHSPLTLDGLTLRGLHLRGGGLEMHAGYTYATLYQGVFLPADREAALGASYRRTAGRTSFGPSVYWFPTVSEHGGSRGALASFNVSHGGPLDPLRVHAELGYGRKLGAAGDLSWQAGGQRAWLEARHQPYGIASVGVGRPHGTFVDGSWTGRLGGRLTSVVAGSVARYELPLVRQRNDAASVDLRYRPFGRLSLSAGAALGAFDGQGGALDARSVTVPVGLSWDGSRAGLGVLYRYQRNTATNEGGHGGRARLRLSWPRFQLSAFLDRQEDAPTLELVFREEPELARALAELGLTAHTPADIARLLEESAPLVEQGFVEGVTLHLVPLRLQAGADVAWTPTPRHQFRLHLLQDRSRTVARNQDTRFATLSYVVGVGRSLDLFGSASRWSRDYGLLRDEGTAFRVGLRVRFGGVPRLPSALRKSSISGVVYQDDDGAGVFEAGRPPLPGTEVRLDGALRAITDARGRYRFDGVEPGAHRVEAILPARPGAYFTTPSLVTVPEGGRASFGLAFSPGRLIGVLRSDAGVGLAGVRVRLQGPHGAASASTDSSGRFVFAAGAGDYVATVETGSLPAGYDGSTIAACAVQVTLAKPAHCEYVLRAQRSLSGVVRGHAPEQSEVRLLELQRAVRPGPDGRYVFRNLGAGRYTLETVVGGRPVRRQVEVPAAPASVRNVDLGSD